MTFACAALRLGDFSFDEELDTRGEYSPDPLDMLMARESLGEYVYHLERSAVDAAYPSVR